MKKSTTDKLEYFKDYYLGKTIIGLVLVFLVVFTIVHFLTRKEPVSGVCPISLDPVNSVAVDSAYFDGFLEQNGYIPISILFMSSLISILAANLTTMSQGRMRTYFKTSC